MFLIRCHRPLSMQTMRTSIGSATAASPSHRRRSLRRRRRHRRRRRRRRPAAFWRAPCGPAGRAIRWPSIRARPSLQVGWLLFIDWFIKKKKHDHNQILLVPKQKRKAPFFVLHSCLLYRSISPSFFCFHLQIFITFFLGGGGVVRNTANLSSFLFVVFRSVWSFYSAHYLWRWHLLHIWNVFVEFFFTSLLPTIWFVRRVCVDGRANAVARDRTFIDHRTKAKIKKKHGRWFGQ